MFSTLLNLTAVSFTVIGAVVGVAAVIYRRFLAQQFDKASRQPLAPAVPEVGAPPSPVLTTDQMVAAMYEKIMQLGKLQFWSNFAWAVFGIGGGYLIGHILPH